MKILIRFKHSDREVLKSNVEALKGDDNELKGDIKALRSTKNIYIVMKMH